MKDGEVNLLHQENPDLAGVIIYHNDPVNMDDKPPRKKDEHPSGIVYYFWNEARVHDVAYDKQGTILRDNWIKRFEPIRREEWLRVDFTYGSDPNFKNHADPRK